MTSRVSFRLADGESFRERFLPAVAYSFNYSCCSCETIKKGSCSRRLCSIAEGSPVVGKCQRCLSCSRVPTSPQARVRRPCNTWLAVQPPLIRDHGLEVCYPVPYQDLLGNSCCHDGCSCCLGPLARGSPVSGEYEQWFPCSLIPTSPQACVRRPGNTWPTVQPWPERNRGPKECYPALYQDFLGLVSHHGGCPHSFGSLAGGSPVSGDRLHCIFRPMLLTSLQTCVRRPCHKWPSVLPWHPLRSHESGFRRVGR